MTKVGGIRKIMVLWQAVFLAASPLVTAPPSNLTRLYYNGSAAKSHSTTTQYRQLRRLGKVDALTVDDFTMVYVQPARDANSEITGGPHNLFV